MKKYVLLIVAIWSFVACADFLEPKSDTLYVPKDVASLDEMLLGTAYPRPTDYSTKLNAGIQLLDDDVTCASLKGSLSASAERELYGLRYLYSWQSDMFEELSKVGKYKEIWEFHYQLILGANAALDYVDEVTGTYNEKTLVRAQAHALRGFYFFNLVNIFGEPFNHNPKALGIPLKLTSNVEEQDIARSTVEEVYEQIVKDLDEAEKLYLTLPKNFQYRLDLRVSLPMVQLLKSRVFLYMENWKESAKYAKKVIDDWNFLLINLNDLKLSTSEFREYYPFISQKASDVIWLFGHSSDIAYCYSYTVDVETSATSTASRSLFIASPGLIEGFKPGDLRKERYIFRESYKYPDVFLAHGKIEPSYSTSSLAAMNSFSQAFRLAEAYLNLAEAAAMDKDEDTALKVLNDLRKKRFIPETPDIEISGLTGNALVDKIRQERRLELCFEFHRWFDLRRYGMPSIKHVWQTGGAATEFVLPEKSLAYTLPIPEVVMNKNRALVQNKRSNPK